MKILILGAGHIGATLAAYLVEEGHEITVVDIDSEKLSNLQERYDLKTVLGHASYPKVLKKSGAQQADMLIAVTNDDEVNMIACQVGYSLFNIPAKIARVRSADYFVGEQLFDDDNLPVDLFINPEALITDYIKDLIEYPGTSVVLNFEDDLAKIVGMRLPSKSPVLGFSLNKMAKEYPNISVLAIYRHKKSQPLSKTTKLQQGDELFFMAGSQEIKSLVRTFSRVTDRYKQLFVAGGGRVGGHLVAQLDENYAIKVIDHNKQNCEVLANALTESIVLYGDATDRELLLDEQIEHCDVFCALTNDDDANIMASLQAKKLGAKQVIALINRPEYIDLVEQKSIDVVINPQQATIGSVLTRIRQGDVLQVHAMRNFNAEVMDVRVHGDVVDASIVGRSIDALDLPAKIRLGGVIRGPVFLLPSSSLKIQHADRLIVFVADKTILHKGDKLF